MQYHHLAQFAQTAGLIFFVLLFLGVVAYALWPRNRDKFRDAARIPLKED